MLLAGPSQYGDFFKHLIAQLERRNDIQANINLTVLEQNLDRLLTPTSSHGTLQSTTPAARWGISAEAVQDAREAVAKTRGAVGVRNWELALANADRAYSAWKSAFPKAPAEP